MLFRSKIGHSRLIRETNDPLTRSEKSHLLYKMTKLAYPFYGPRMEQIRESIEQNSKCCIKRKSRKYFRANVVGNLIRVRVCTRDEIYNDIFQDTKTNEVYRVVSQKSNLLHCPCKWTKLVSYDTVHGFPEALGSTEILVPNKYMSKDMIPVGVIKRGSYNFKDIYIGGRVDHFCDDVCCCVCI